MFRWIVFIAFLPSALAQLTVTVSPVPDSLAGITVIGPGNPVYLPAVQALIGAAQYPAYQPMLPYSVLVRNDSARPIVDVCAVFVVAQFSLYQNGSFAECPGNVPPLEHRQLLAPGSAILLSAVPHYDYLQPRPKPPLAANPQRVAQVTGAKSIVFTLDSAIFADGTIAGPDTQNNFESFSAQLAADRDFAAAVQTYQSGPITALESYLDSMGNASRAGLQSSVYDSAYSGRLRQDARDLKFMMSSHNTARHPAPTPEQIYAAAASIGSAAAGFTLHR